MISVGPVMDVWNDNIFMHSAVEFQPFLFLKLSLTFDNSSNLHCLYAQRDVQSS